ncbi:MAG: hypothetical protein GC136_03640 [Alphaproteobacteria bacterium]|nr:hypothetical protein [Alphaproteobacteria bacterium]
MKKDNASTGSNWKKRLTHAAIGLGAVFAAAAGCLTVEYNGYEIPGWDGSKRVLCDIDPTCRTLTEGEIEMARETFGDQIDYENVLIFNRPYFAFISPATGGSAMSPNGNIYVSNAEATRNDYSQSNQQGMFIHEMSHVWQDQHGANLQMAALDLLLRRGHYDASYYYIPDENPRFAEMNIEEQARLLELMHVDSNRLTQRWPMTETEPAIPVPPRKEVASQIVEEPEFVPPITADFPSPRNATDRQICDNLRMRYRILDGTLPREIPCLHRGIS